jgi:hypothetical protein
MNLLLRIAPRAHPQQAPSIRTTEIMNRRTMAIAACVVGVLALPAFQRSIKG